MGLLQGHHRPLVEELKDTGPLGPPPVVPRINQPPYVPRGDTNQGACARRAVVTGPYHVPE
eukprot:6517294-Alexandrium_andersonii.AAC.1